MSTGEQRLPAVVKNRCQYWTVDCLTSYACYISFTILLQRVVVGYFGSCDITCCTFAKGHSLAIVQNMIDSLQTSVCSDLTKGVDGACNRILYSLRIYVGFIMWVLLSYYADTHGHVRIRKPFPCNSNV